MQFFIGTLLVLSSLFLIALVLIQQGKGGGLAGAFGGMGGQSAFGTKAGDVFTRVTIITALVWIFFCMLAIKLIGKDSGTRRNQDSKSPPPVAAPATPGAPVGVPATGTPATGTPATTTPAAPAATGSTPATTTPDPMAPAATTPAPMTPATTPEASAPVTTTPVPATPAPSTPEPSAPATPTEK